MNYLVNSFVMVILLLIMVLLFLSWIILGIIRDFLFSRGKGRRIAGEFLRDIGIATFVSVSFTMDFGSYAYIFSTLLTVFLIIIGIRMKEYQK